VGQHGLQPGDALADQPVLVAQVRRVVRLRVVEQARHLVEGEPELAVGERVVQPGDVGAGVPAVPGAAAAARPHQPHLVVVVQRAHRHPGQPGDLPDAQTLLVRRLHGSSLVDVPTLAPHAA
jgi:hypothetical protein